MKKLNYLFLCLAILFSAVTYTNAEKIMIISGSDITNPHNVEIDSIVKSMGYTTVLVSADSAIALGTTGFDAILISEVPGSSSFSDIKHPGILALVTALPCVSLKSYGFRADKEGWCWFQNLPAEFYTISGTTFIDQSGSYIEIVNHAIWTGIGSAGEKVDIVDVNTLGDGGLFQVFDLKLGTVSNKATKIGILEYAKNDVTIIPDGVVWAVEKSLSADRTVIIGTHSKFSLTDKGHKLIKNSLLWAMGKEVSVRSNMFQPVNLKVYPNPSTDFATISLGNNISSNVVITNITGQVVSEFVAQGNMTRIETNSFSPGVYFVKSNSEVVKLIIK